MNNKKKYIIIASLILLLGLIGKVIADSLGNRLAGRILIETENSGEAWYVEPQTMQRIYLGRPADAFAVMKNFGLGISEADYKKFVNNLPSRLAGRILLRVQAKGEAYYANPLDRQLYYLGRPRDAFELMRNKGLGISQKDIGKIAIGNFDYGQEQFASEEGYPWHRGISATVFWVGEPKGNGSSENNAMSAWDDDWQEHYGGYDNPFCRDDYLPCGFTPQENPFYVSQPFDDFSSQGKRRKEAYDYVPWSAEKEWGERESMLKNKWVEIRHAGKTCYAQVEDTGPYVYDDYEYVFLGKQPKNNRANSAGMDVSPAVRDCLGFQGENNAANKIDWRFVPFASVPAGPWKKTITTRQVNW